MTDGAALLATIRESPDEDTPRLAYADWLDEHGDVDRAEFIRVQCDVARLSEADPRRTHAEVRERQLLAQHALKWSVPIPPFGQWEYAGDGPYRTIFRRGFVDEINGCDTPNNPYDDFEALCGSHPIRHLAAGGYGVGNLTAFASRPEVEWLRALSISVYEGYGRPHNHFRDQIAAVDTFVRTAKLTRLARFAVSIPQLSPTQVAEWRRLLGLPPASAPVPRTTAPIPTASPFSQTDADVIRLAETPQLEQTVRLSLWLDHNSGDSLTALFASPRLAQLRYLRVRGGSVPVPAIRTLARNPALRHLRVLYTGVLREPRALTALTAGKTFPDLHTLGFAWPRRTELQGLVEEVINSPKFPRLCVVPFAVDHERAEQIAVALGRCKRIAWAGGEMIDGGDGTRFSAVPDNVYLPNLLDDMDPW